MGLNIKNPETHRLAKEVANLAGESLTTAITEALRERLARLRGRKREGVAERLMAIGRDMASRMSEETRTLDLDEFLYDENGLPK